MLSEQASSRDATFIENLSRLPYREAFAWTGVASERLVESQVQICGIPV
jgi:hypothetical protein